MHSQRNVRVCSLEVPDGATLEAEELEEDRCLAANE
jgi:hypothetical protein